MYLPILQRLHWLHHKRKMTCWKMVKNRCNGCNWNQVFLENNLLHWDVLCLNYSLHFMLQPQCIRLLYSSNLRKISLDKILKMAPANQSATQIWQNPNDIDSIVWRLLLFLAPLLGLPWTCSNIVQTDLKTDLGSRSKNGENRCFTEFSQRLVWRMYPPVYQQKAFNTTSIQSWEKESNLSYYTNI